MSASAPDGSRDSTKSVEPVSHDAALPPEDQMALTANATEQSNQTDYNNEWQNAMAQPQSQTPFGFNGNGMMNGFGNNNWGMGGMNSMMAMQNGMQMQGWTGIPNMGKLGQSPFCKCCG